MFRSLLSFYFLFRYCCMATRSFSLLVQRLIRRERIRTALADPKGKHHGWCLQNEPKERTPHITALFLLCDRLLFGTVSTGLYPHGCGVCRYCRSKYLPCPGETCIVFHGDAFRQSGAKQDAVKGGNSFEPRFSSSPFSRPVAVSVNQGQPPRTGD